MDERHIEQGLRDLLIAEPPLGIDPDQVADLAARTKRNRQAGVTTGVGVLAVAGLAAGAFAFTSGASPGGPVQPTGVLPVGDPTGPADPVDPKERNVAHLREVLPTLLPGAREVKLDATWGRGKDQPQVNVQVNFTDSVGPAQFQLTISNIADAMPPLDAVCENDNVPGAGGWPDGGPLRCEKTKQPGGDTLVIMELGVKGKPTYLHVIDYRDGSHAVSVGDGGRYPGPNSHALTDEQAIALATDEAFSMS